MYDCVYFQHGMRSLVDQSTSETSNLLKNINTGLAEVYVLGLPPPAAASYTVTLNNTLPLTSSWDTKTQVRRSTACMHTNSTLLTISNP